MTLNTLSQNWSEPSQVNTLFGSNGYPDYYIANDGTIHCAWSYKIENNHRIIYYSKSTDGGQNWTVPENVSQNTSLSMIRPQIVADSENSLHLTYGYNMMDVYQSLIVYKQFKGEFWSEIDTVSHGWPGSYGNLLLIDNTDKLYCFWVHTYQNGTMFYRTFENNEWDIIVIPYNNLDSHYIESAIVDNLNNIYCSGSHHHDGQGPYDFRQVSFNFNDNSWQEFVQLGDDTSKGQSDISLSSSNEPIVVWKQYISDFIPPNIGILYSESEGTNWTGPEVITEDASYPTIAIDSQNKAHIVLAEEFSDGYQLVHFRKISEEWIGQIIDESSIAFLHNKLLFHDQQLHLIYSRSDTAIAGQVKSSIIYSSLDISTHVTDNFELPFASFHIYPNPTKWAITISYKLRSQTHTEISIYDMRGNLVKSLYNASQPEGYHEALWDGINNQGLLVLSGTYYVRLRINNQFVTKPIIIK